MNEAEGGRKGGREGEREGGRERNRPITHRSPPTHPPTTSHYPPSSTLQYLEGNGVVKDDKEAFKWFRKAAEQHSYPEAMHNLATMYRDGKGVPKKDTEAFKWFVKAAEQGTCAYST